MLEEPINKRISNKEPRVKASYYQEGTLEGTKMGYSISQRGFDKNAIDSITREIVDFCLRR